MRAQPFVALPSRRLLVCDRLELDLQAMVTCVAFLVYTRKVGRRVEWSLVSRVKRGADDMGQVKGLVVSCDSSNTLFSTIAFYRDVPS